MATPAHTRNSTTSVDANVVSRSTGVDFIAGSAAPPNLPGGAGLTPEFVTAAALLADSRPPVSKNGVGVGEELVLRLVYAESKAFRDVLTALRDGSFRIGLQVQSLQNDESDQFVSVPIPLPMGAWLALTAFGGLFFAAWRQRRAAA